VVVERDDDVVTDTGRHVLSTLVAVRVDINVREYVFYVFFLDFKKT